MTRPDRTSLICITGIALSAASVLVAALRPQWPARVAAAQHATSAPRSMPAAVGRPLDPAASAARWIQDIERFEAWDRRNTPPSDAVLFVGSSTIVGWNTARDFPEHAVINRGFGGSRFSDVAHHVGRVVTPYKPRAIVLYAGDNDVADGLSAAQVADAFAALIERIRRDLPDPPILVLSIKPSIARRRLWPEMQEANRRIAAHCRGRPGLTFIDVSAVMLGPDAAPRAELLIEDGLHLSPAGYLAWNELLRPELRRATAR